jgi:RND family efflux transporter MFP subunit
VWKGQYNNRSEAIMEKKSRINIKSIGATIFILILGLLFMSKSIYTYNLPIVTAAMPVNGKLTKQEKVTGSVEWNNTANAYTEASGKVDRVYIEDGDRVMEGDIIAELVFNREDMSSSRDKAYDIESIDKDIRNAEEDREKKQALYDEGIVPKNELDQAERSLNALLQRREKAVYDYHENTAKLDQTKLIVYAPCDGEVLTVDIHEGQRVNEGQLVATFGELDSLKITCRISIDNNFVLTGDECYLENTSHYITALVKKITPVTGAKEILIAMPADEVEVGETFDITFEKSSSQSQVLVPNGALNMDSDGYFLYQVKRREGMLGKELYVQKLRVYIGDNDDEHTIISKGITFYEPIVLISDKGLTEGKVVKLENAGDFFTD